MKGESGYLFCSCKAGMIYTQGSTDGFGTVGDQVEGSFYDERGEAVGVEDEVGSRSGLIP
jgi:hypothetical protein